MKIEKTERGFDINKFTDLYGSECSLQKSSLATKNTIWLGLSEADPQIMESKVKKNGRGWVKYPLHQDVSIATRMHLSQEQVKELLPILQKFVETGEIE